MKDTKGFGAILIRAAIAFALGTYAFAIYEGLTTARGSAIDDGNWNALNFSSNAFFYGLLALVLGLPIGALIGVPIFAILSLPIVRARRRNGLIALAVVVAIVAIVAGLNAPPDHHRLT